MCRVRETESSRRPAGAMALLCACAIPDLDAVDLRVAGDVHSGCLGAADDRAAHVLEMLAELPIDLDMDHVVPLGNRFPLVVHPVPGNLVAAPVPGGLADRLEQSGVL